MTSLDPASPERVKPLRHSAMRYFNPTIIEISIVKPLARSR
jgi:hypothetical protein